MLNLPDIIENPKAVIYDRNNGGVLFIFDPATGDGRLGKIVVKTGEQARMAHGTSGKKSQAANRVITAGLVPTRNLGGSRYVVIKGSL